MAQIDKLISYAKSQWPEMPEDVKVVQVARGTRIVLREGCCKRTFVQLQPLEIWESNQAKLVGYVGYHQKSNRLFVRIVDTL